MKNQILLLFIFLATESFAQFTVKGRISDATTKRPLQNVSVVSNQGTGILSGPDGFFELRSNGTIEEIKASLLAYDTQIIKIADPNQFLDILLVESAGQKLDEVKITSKYYKEYNLNTVSSALRIQSPLINLSQNIQEIGTKLIADQAVFNMTDGVSRNVSGVVRQEVSKT